MMNLLKRIVSRLIFFPDWLAAVIVFPSFALLIYVFAAGLESSLPGYISYFLSAYSLLLICARIPGVIRAVRTGFERHPRVRQVLDSERGERYLSDAVYRAEVSLYSGLAVNILYAAIKLVSGIVYHSLWFGALSGYYLLLAVLRFALLNHLRQDRSVPDRTAEWKRYRLCGMVLLLMNQALAVVVFMVVRRDYRFEYPGILIYAIAAYTFYAVVVAAINMGRSRKENSPILSALRTVNLIAALVSLLSLETAMFEQFGTTDDVLLRRIMTGATGAAVCTVVLIMALYMIVLANRQLSNDGSKRNIGA